MNFFQKMTKPQLWMFALSIVLLIPAALFQYNHSYYKKGGELFDFSGLFEMLLFLTGNLIAAIYLFIYFRKVKFEAFVPIALSIAFSIITKTFFAMLIAWMFVIGYIIMGVIELFN